MEATPDGGSGASPAAAAGPIVADGAGKSGAAIDTSDISAATPAYCVLLCYLYSPVEDTVALAEWFRATAGPAGLNLTGRVLVSSEGINVNLASCLTSPEELAASSAPEGVRGIPALRVAIDAHPVIGGGRIDYKLDISRQQPFPDFAVKEVSEVVATGGSMPVELLFEEHLGGTHLAPEDFHAVLESYMGPDAPAGAEVVTVAPEAPATAGTEGDAASTADASAAGDAEVGAGDGATAAAAATTGERPPLVVIDVRNRKEIEFGRFRGSMNSDTKMFSEWAEHFAKPRVELLKRSKVLMYCTGGVRCEKASAYLRSLGIEDVSQLSGGIHRYLEKYGSKGYFEGSNFVFDSRGLQRPPGAAVVGVCFGCGGAEETLSSDRVCAVCRDTVLMCDPCRLAKQGVYFCRDHEALEGSYYPFLQPYPTSELRRQHAALSAMCAPGGSLAGPTGRNRRRAIRKQLKRIDECIAARESGADDATATPDAAAADTAGSGRDGAEEVPRDGAATGAASGAGTGAGAGARASAGAGAGAGTAGTGPASLASGGSVIADKARCRSCGQPCRSLLLLMGEEAVALADAAAEEDLCQGDCWGFFQRSRRDRGYVDLNIANGVPDVSTAGQKRRFKKAHGLAQEYRRPSAGSASEPAASGGDHDPEAAPATSAAAPASE